MDELRAARGLPPQTRDNLMNRTRAAVAYVGTAHSETQREKLALHAFMDIFHPEVPVERVREMVRGQR